MAAMKEMKEMMAGLEARINSLEGEASALKAEVAALKKAPKSSKKAKEVPAKKTKASKSEDESEEEEPKPKSDKMIAWNLLYKAVRAVHSKDAMIIASILKDEGNIEPTEEDIEAAASKWDTLYEAVVEVHKKDAKKIANHLKKADNWQPTKQQIEAAASQLPEGDKPAKSGSESEGSKGAAKKSGRPKKAVAE